MMLLTPMSSVPDATPAAITEPLERIESSTLRPAFSKKPWSLA
jgi:hypothetical protein